MSHLRTYFLIAAAAVTFSGSALASSYTVKSGDTLYSIAKKANVDPADLVRLNNLGSSTINLGQVLKLDDDAQAGAPGQNSAPQNSTTQNAAAQAPASGGAYVRAAATRFLGIRYMLGGNGAGGIDCSAFTRAVFSQLGVSLPRTARAQYGVGTPVARGNLQAGDLVFFNTIGGISHVGIYMGGGQFANANSYNGRTIIENMNTSYWSPRFVGARRVLRG